MPDTIHSGTGSNRDKTVRTLLILNNINPGAGRGVGGAEQLALNLCYSFDRSRIDPQIAVKDDPGKAGKNLTNAGIKVHRLPKRGRFDPSFWRSLRSMLASENIDVALSVLPGLNFHLLLTALTLPKLACIISVHHVGLPEPMLAITEGLLAGRASFLVVPSEASAVSLYGKYRLPKERFAVIPNGIDEKRFRFVPYKNRIDNRDCLDVPNDAFLLYTPGRIHKLKGQDILAEALVILGQDYLREKKLLWVNTGMVQDKELDAKIAETVEPIKGHVRILLSTDKPEEWYAAADCVVLPSRTESLPLALLEAGSAGRMFLATSVGAVPEIADDSGVGVVTEPDSPEALADGIRKIVLLSENDLASAGSKISKFVRENYSLSKCVEQYSLLIERAAAERSRKSRA